MDPTSCLLVNQELRAAGRLILTLLWPAVRESKNRICRCALKFPSAKVAQTRLSTQK
jgi:hypothetical protein